VHGSSSCVGYIATGLVHVLNRDIELWSKDVGGVIELITVNNWSDWLTDCMME